MYTAWGSMVCDFKEKQPFERYQNYEVKEGFTGDPCLPDKGLYNRSTECWKTVYKNKNNEAFCIDVTNAGFTTSQKRVEVLKNVGASPELCNKYFNPKTGERNADWKKLTETQKPTSAQPTQQATSTQNGKTSASSTPAQPTQDVKTSASSTPAQPTQDVKTSASSTPAQPTQDVKTSASSTPAQPTKQASSSTQNDKNYISSFYHTIAQHVSNIVNKF
jgi:outer membrane biosynthesis protein TonB